MLLQSERLQWLANEKKKQEVVASWRTVSFRGSLAGFWFWLMAVQSEAPTPRGTAEEPQRRRRARPIQLWVRRKRKKKNSLPDLDLMSRRPRKAVRHRASSAHSQTVNHFYRGLLQKKPPQDFSEHNELKNTEGSGRRRRKRCVSGLQLGTLAVIEEPEGAGPLAPPQVGTGWTFGPGGIHQRLTRSSVTRENHQVVASSVTDTLQVGGGRSQMGRSQSPLITKFNTSESASRLIPDQYCEMQFIKSWPDIDGCAVDLCRPFSLNQ